MSEPNPFDDYINTHPKESITLLIIILSLVWQSVPSVIGFGLYLIFIRGLKMPWWVMGIASAVVIAVTVYFNRYQLAHMGITGVLGEGFRINGGFWKYLVTGNGHDAIYYLYREGLSYLIGIPFLIATILSVIDLYQHSPHINTMNDLQQGIHSDDRIEISGKKLTKAFNQLSDDHHSGTLLGVSHYTGKRVVISDHDVNQIVMVLGTTGSGKTVTLRRFYQRAIKKGYPLIVVDGKPDESNIAWLMTLAEDNGRPFFGFNGGNYCHYDPLANGGFTELKDKIICLKDQWENDYFRSIAEDYLQTTFAVLQRAGQPFDLKRVAACLNYHDLAIVARETKDEGLIKKIAALAHYDRKDITGLQAHLNLLIHSELGKFFEMDESLFTLRDTIRQCGVAYFALPALRFPSFAKVLGKLVINDIKAVIDRNTASSIPVFTIFDEFSVFAGEQVLNLVNMGRGKGVHAVFGTQGLADLDKVDPTFKSQMMNCANTLICHRLNDVESAETVSNWVGTKDMFTVTAQLSTKQVNAEMGTVKRNKEFIVHPDSIKQGLRTGEAFYISKVGEFRCEKVKVWHG